MKLDKDFTERRNDLLTSTAFSFRVRWGNHCLGFFQFGRPHYRSADPFILLREVRRLFLNCRTARTASAAGAVSTDERSIPSTVA